MGVEPTTGAWEATVLPLHYGRVKTFLLEKMNNGDYNKTFKLFKRQKSIFVK